MRRLFHDLLAVVRAGVAGSYHRADSRGGMTELAGDFGDLREWFFEVALDVGAERLEGRDVYDLDLIFKRRLLGLTEQAIDADEEGGEGLSGAGGSCDERIAPGHYVRPAERLGICGRLEASLEPSANGWVE